MGFYGSKIFIDDEIERKKEVIACKKRILKKSNSRPKTREVQTIEILKKCIKYIFKTQMINLICYLWI